VNGPAGVKSLQFYVDLANKYKVTQPGPVAHNRSDIQNMFAGIGGSSIIIANIARLM
jgi:hypothetical protein